MMKNFKITVVFLISLIFTCLTLHTFTYAAVDTKVLEGVLNGVVAPKSQNQMMKPQMSDRNNSQENIDNVTGALILKENDITLPGKDGFDLTIGRIYDSSKATYGAKKVFIEPEDGNRTMETKLFYCASIYYYDNSNGFNFMEEISGVEELYADTEAELQAMIDIKVILAEQTNRTAVASGIISMYKDVYKSTSKLRMVNYTFGYNDLKKAYDLGVGWAFSFPYIQHELGGVYKYYHDGQGGTYRIINTPSENDSNLENYEGNDLKVVRYDSYSNGETTSYHKAVKGDGTEMYFAVDGRLIGMKDRYGNEIVFKHKFRSVIPEFGAYHISQIIDSVGRKITFEYENDANLTDEKIIIKITDPKRTNDITFKYNRKRVMFNCTNDYTNLKPEQEYQHLLSSVEKPNGDIISYEDYSLYNDGIKNETKFSFDKKDLSQTGYATMPVHIIGAIKYLNTTTFYNYDKITRYMGDSGATEEYRVNKRYDTEQRQNKTNVEFEWTDEKNIVDYIYKGDFTGYPEKESENFIDENYRFYTESFKDKIRHSTHYNGNRIVISDTIYYPNGEHISYEPVDYHPRFHNKPIKLNIQKHDVNNDVISDLYVQYGYNWADGAVSFQSRPVEASIGKNNSETNATLASYGVLLEFGVEKFNLPHKKNWYLDANTKCTESYDYDSNGRLLSVTNAKGEVTKYEYEFGTEEDKITITKELENGKVSKTEKIFGKETNKAFATSIIDYYTDEKGITQKSKKSYTYNMIFGLVETETDDNGRTTTYKYDSLGRLISTTLPNFTNQDGEIYSVEKKVGYNTGYSTEYSTDKYTGIYGIRLEEMTEYKNTSTGKVYSFNQTSSVYDGYGNLCQVSKYDYDKQKWVIQEKHEYDNYQKLIKSWDVDNNMTACSYDDLGRLKEVTDCYNNLYITEYEMRKAISSDYDKKVTNYFVQSSNVSKYRSNPSSMLYREYVIDTYYDDWERLQKKVAYPEWPSASKQISESYEYDLNDNLKTYTDPKANKNEDGVTKTFSYDKLDRVVMVKDALNQITDINYNTLGAIQNIKLRQSKSSTDSVVLYSKNYDERGLLTEQTHPNTPVDDKVKNVFNSLGLNVSTVDRNGNTYNKKYDDLGQLQVNGFTAPDNKTLEFKYNYTTPYGPSKVSEYTDNVNTSNYITYKYTPFGELNSKTIVYSGDNYQSNLDNTFDNSGRLTDVSIANGASDKFTTKYYYNKTRLDKVQSDGSQINDATGKNFVKYDYYDDGNVRTITYPTLKDGTILKSEYTYNKLNQLQSLTNYKGTTVLSKYSYAYDANGNTETVNDGKETKTYIYDGLNRLKEIRRTSGVNSIYDYDLRGNRLTLDDNMQFLSEEASYTFNSRNQLAQVVKGNAKTDYSYDAEGLRYKKSSLKDTILYKYNNDGQLISEADGNGVVKSNYIRDGSKVLSKKEGTDNYYYLYNGHGDVIQIINANGDVVNNYQYDEWGNILSKNENIKNPFTYAGEVFDEETGLYYLKARYYDPTQGRFISEDSYLGKAVNPLSLNLYTYCENDPISYVDPSGHIINLVGTKSEQTEMLKFIQRLTADEIDIAKNGNVTIKNFNFSDEYKAKTSGSNLIARLITSDKTVSIILSTSDSSKAAPFSWDNATNGKGSDAVVIINFSNQSSQTWARNQNGGKAKKMYSPIQIILGHELIHADRFMRGVAFTQDKETKYSAVISKFFWKKTKLTKMVPNEELATVGLKYNNDITENNLRDEQSEWRRIQY